LIEEITWGLKERGVRDSATLCDHHILFFFDVASGTLNLSVQYSTGTRVDHEFMVQSWDQRLESSGTALARVYHNFVQIRAIEFNKVRTKEPNSIWYPLQLTLG